MSNSQDKKNPVRYKFSKRTILAILMITGIALAGVFLVSTCEERDAESPTAEPSPTVQPPAALPTLTGTATQATATFTPTPQPTLAGTLLPSPTPLPVLFPHTKACEDGADNDNDGYFDLSDPQCRNEKDNDESK